MSNDIIARRRKQVGELFQEGLTERGIANCLGVSRTTVFNDLAYLDLKRDEPSVKRDKEQDAAIDAALEELVDSGEKLSRPELVKHIKDKTGADRSHGALESRLGRITAERLKAVREKPAEIIDWETVTGTAKDKLEAMRRQVQRELEAEFEARVLAEVHKRLEPAIKALERREQTAARLIEGRKGVFTATEYRMIKACLHPDGRDSVSVERLDRAFRLVNEADILLVDDKQMPMSSLPPMDELLKRRGKKVS